MNGQLPRDMRAVFGAAGRPGFLFGIYFFFAVLGTIALVTGLRGPLIAGLLFALGTGFTSVALGFGCVALANDLHELRLPQRRALLPHSHAAIMITTVCTLMMPGLLLAAFYRNWGSAAMTVGGVLFGLLVPVQPVYALGGYFTCIVLAAFSPSALGAVTHDYKIVAVSTTGMVLVLLLFGRWRALLAGRTGWQGVHVLRVLRMHNSSTSVRSASLARRPDWLFASMPPVRSRPSPTRAIRTFFGEPYAPVLISRRLWQLLAPGAVVIAALSVWILSQHSVHAAMQELRTAALPILGVASWFAGMSFFPSLPGKFRVGSGEMIELGLLPGLGTARSRTRSLYEASLAPPILLIAGFFATALLVAWLERSPASTYASITIFAISVLLVVAAVILRILIGTDLQQSSVLGLAGLITVTVVAVLAWVTDHDHAQRLVVHWILPGLWFGLLWVMSAVVLYKCARELALRPHPFVAV